MQAIVLWGKDHLGKDVNSYGRKKRKLELNLLQRQLNCGGIYENNLVISFNLVVVMYRRREGLHWATRIHWGWDRGQFKSASLDEG